MARAPSAKRYAQAAFQIALESREMERWMEDLQRAWSLLGNEKVRTYLGMPQVSLEDKMRAIRAALKGSLVPAQNLVGLLASRLSLELLPRIIDEYQGLLDAHQERDRGEIVTAVPLEGDQKQRVQSLIEQVVSKQVVLTDRVDHEVMGGVVIRVGDKVLDGSTRTKLNGLKRRLAQDGLV